MNESVPRYTHTAIALHWILALALAASFVLGVVMTDMPMSMTRLKLYNVHKWAGVLILALSVLRLAWRLTHRPPPAPPMPVWQARAATAVHAALYVAFLGVPLLGWAYSSAAGFPVVLFGVLPLPDLLAPDRELAQRIKPWHGRAAFALGALVLVHLAAVIKHQWRDHDGLLARMSLFRRSHRDSGAAGSSRA